MIWQFSDQHEQAQSWLDITAFDARLKSKELYRMAQNTGLKRQECEARHLSAIRYDHEYYRTAFRDIASDTNERTLIFALLPKGCGVGNTINISVPKSYLLQPDGSVGVEVVSPLRLLFATAWFNSLPSDWLARFMVQIHVNKTYLMRLPLPQPMDAEILSNDDYCTLARNALLLTLANSPQHFSDLFTQFSPVLNINRNDIPQSQKAQDKLRNENDKLVAKGYGMSDEELAYILQSFNVMRNKRPEYVALFGD